MSPPNQNVIMLQQAVTDLKENVNELKSRVGNLEIRLDAKYDLLTEKLDNLFKWLVGLLITSILIPGIFLLATYYINHPK